MSRRILITGAGSGPCNNLMRSLLHGRSCLDCADRLPLRSVHAEAVARAAQFSAAASRFRAGSSQTFDQALRAVVASARVDLVIPGNDRDARALAEMRERAAAALPYVLARAEDHRAVPGQIRAQRAAARPQHSGAAHPSGQRPRFARTRPGVPSIRASSPGAGSAGASPRVARPRCATPTRRGTGSATGTPCGACRSKTSRFASTCRAATTTSRDSGPTAGSC